jgi:hypothetical protein
MQTISKHSQLYAEKERTRRCSSSKGRSVTPDTPATTTPDFLRQRFLPLCAMNNEALPKQQCTEVSYFKSLEKLCSLHQLEPFDVTDKLYPYNILLSFWDARRKVSAANEDMELQIISDKGKTLISTTDSIDADHKLFYVPVEPLYLLSQRKGIEDKKATNVLYSVFAYLYHHVGLPYYRSEESFQYWHYEMIESWIMEADDEGETAETEDHLKEIEEAKYYGDLIESKIYSFDNLRYFGTRLQSLKPATDWQRRCAVIGKAFYDLHLNFPNASLASHLQLGTNPYYDEIEADDRIQPHQYLGFVNNTKGWLGETLFETISNELNECVATDHPAVTHVYDEHLISLDENINYERKLFFLIGELYTLLNDIKWKI